MVTIIVCMQNINNKQVVMKTQIILVDDHELIRQGIKRTIDDQQDMDVCAEAEDSSTALILIEKKQPNLVILDISLQEEITGLQLLKIIHEKFPAVKVLMLSMHDETSYIESAIKNGAQGYITKNDSLDIMLEAIRSVVSGSMYLSPVISGKVLNKLINKKPTSETFDTLTTRETEVFLLIGQGYVTSEIANELNMSVNTVESHRRNIKDKLGIKKGPELLKKAIQYSNSI